MNQNTTLIRKQNRDEITLQKYTMISPLLDENIDPPAARELRSKLAEQNGLSERTLRRYVNAYQEKGFEGLKPAERVRYKKEVKNLIVSGTFYRGLYHKTSLCSHTGVSTIRLVCVVITHLPSIISQKS